MVDPIRRLAMQRMVVASAAIEAQLMAGTGTQPIAIVLFKARDEAAAALTRLACENRADINNLETIRALQDEVRRFDNLVRWFSEIVRQGFEYDRELTSEDREEMIAQFAQTPEGAEEAMALGLIERNPHADF